MFGHEVAPPRVAAVPLPRFPVPDYPVENDPIHQEDKRIRDAWKEGYGIQKQKIKHIKAFLSPVPVNYQMYSEDRNKRILRFLERTLGDVNNVIRKITEKISNPERKQNQDDESESPHLDMQNWTDCFFSEINSDKKKGYLNQIMREALGIKGPNDINLSALKEIGEAITVYLASESQDELSADQNETLNPISDIALNHKLTRKKRKKNAFRVILFMSYPVALWQDEAAKCNKIVKEGNFSQSAKLDGVSYSVLKVLFAIFPHVTEDRNLLTELMRHCNINEQDQTCQRYYGFTPLMSMIAKGRWHNAYLFVEQALPLRLNLQLHDAIFQNNALLYALKQGPQQDPIGWQKFVHLLIQHIENINAQDINGSTALHIASYRKEEGLVEALLKKRADPKILNQQGQSAEDLWKMNVDHWKDDIILTSTPDPDTITFDTETKKHVSAEPPKFDAAYLS